MSDSLCQHVDWSSRLAGARLVLAGHGSRDVDGIRESESFASFFQQSLPESIVSYGFLEFQRPDLWSAVSSALCDAGASSTQPIIIIPSLLAAATHAKNDMPSLIREARSKFPGVDVRFAAVMDLHPKLLQLCQLRIFQAEAKSARLISRGDSCLVVVGRGTTDPDANGDIAKLARMLQEGMGFGASVTCYSGTAKPSVLDGLKLASKLGFRRIVVLPYFLFDGVLVKRIYAACEQLKRRMPDIDVLNADYLGSSGELKLATGADAVADTSAYGVLADVFAERAYESLHGEPRMNCGLCKYRAPIPGYENEVASPQMGHQDLARYLLARDQMPVLLDAAATVAPVQAGAQLSQPSNRLKPYEPHPIEAQSFEIIKTRFDWSSVDADLRDTLMRLVHTTGDFECIDTMFFSPGAVMTGVRALLRCRRVVTDVTMVQTGLKRAVLEQLQVATWCGVHDSETEVLSRTAGITRSAAGIRRSWQKFGNDVVLAIGDAPTAVVETVRLVNEHHWRPQLVIGIPVGFVGTLESKELLRNCIQIPRITNGGTRGGSPWAATIVNALMIQAVNHLSRSGDTVVASNA